MPSTSTQALQAVHDLAVPLADDDRHEALLQMIGDARFVLLGEASHGTHEFYRERARITQRLVAERGFHAVAIGGDWPDTFRVNRHVRGLGGDAGAAAALAGFERFPRWMWRNHVMRSFVTWLKEWNGARPAEARVGVYGLDLYSLNRSIGAVLAHLDTEDREAAIFVRERYACLDQFGGDSQVYGLMTGLRGHDSCEAAVRQALRQVLAQATADGGHAGAEARFDAAQNALLVKNAEAYYRSMYLSEESSWNVRDRHMAESLERLDAHLARRLGAREVPRIVVWAHNSWRAEPRPTGARAARRRRVSRGLHHTHGHGHRGVGLGQSRTADAGAAVTPRQPRGAAARERPRPLRAAAAPRAARAPRHAVGAAPRAGHRRDLPARDRTLEPLLPRAARGPVRRGGAPRHHPCAGAAAARPGQARPRGAGDLSLRALSS